MLSILDYLQVFAMSLMTITKSSLHAPVAEDNPVYQQVSYHIIGASMSEPHIDELKPRLNITCSLAENLRIEIR